MGMTKASLKTRIETELAAQGFVLTGPHSGWTSKYAQALANAIVDEIQINARCSGVDSGSDTHDNVQVT